MNKTDTTTIQKFDYSLFMIKYKYLIALGVFIGYLCLSMYKIGNNSLWYDEGFSVDIANDSVSDIIASCIKEDVNPPLYLIILHYWLDLFGDSETALRSLSAVSMSFACGILFLFCQRFFNWQTSIFSTLLFFTSNELFYYSQEGRTFGLIILFYMLSLYTFMCFVKKPSIWNSLLLGLLNGIIFYLHTLASLSFVAQIILFPILSFNKELFFKKEDKPLSFLGFSVKQIIYYMFSWIIFVLLFLPWLERFFELLKQTSGSFWLSKPSSWEFNKCLFEFHNSKELFFTYLIMYTIVLITIIGFKKLRAERLDFKLLILPFIIGPLIMILNFTLSIYSTPIFLKRYILFTIIGFFISYAYVFSILKIDFKIKIGAFLILIFFSARSMIIPRESWFDYKDGVEILKKAEGPRCYISIDMPVLYAYYIDREGLFKKPISERAELLETQHGVYSQTTIYWPNSLDYSKYSDIYYTRTFDDYYDPNRLVDKNLNSRLILLEDIKIKGIHITHYAVPVNRDSIVTVLKQEIKINEGWYKQIIQKAKEKNISTDSMLTLDAIWNFEQKYKSKK